MTDTMQDATTTETVPAYVDDEVGRAFPTTPYLNTRLPATVIDDTRWVHIDYDEQSWDMVWRGTCARCERGVWATVGAEPPKGTAYYISRDRIFMGFEDADGRDWVGCTRCVEDYGINRMRQAAESQGGWGDAADCYKEYAWPEVIADIFRKREEEERRKWAKWVEHIPAEPLHGAAVYVKDEGLLLRFDSWNSDGDAVMVTGEVFPQDKVFTCIPALHGVPHDNAVAIAMTVSNGVTPDKEINAEERVGSVVRWSWNGSHQTVTLRLLSGRTKTFHSDVIALYVPSVNPDKERASAKAKRLQYVLDRMQYGTHARLVSEGTSRSWCEVFDPILDSQGYEPRTARTIISGAIRFSAEVTRLDDSIIEQIKAGNISYIWDYVPRASMAAEGITVERPQVQRLLS